jgi:nucleotide-binding universal stress UspA family protein
MTDRTADNRYPPRSLAVSPSRRFADTPESRFQPNWGQNLATDGEPMPSAHFSVFPVNSITRRPWITESHPMNKLPTLQCDRYGHVFPVAEAPVPRVDTLHSPRKTGPVSPGLPPAEHKPAQPAPSDSSPKTRSGPLPIRRILVPIDADRVKSSDLKPILKVARGFDAEVTLLHCYSTPPSFDYVHGPSALREVSLHRARARAHLLKLCADVQHFFPKCRCEFTFGSLPEQILRASERLQADLIAVPLSLDFVSHCWTTRALLDELVRRANCAVLGVPGASRMANSQRSANSQ